MEHLQADIDQLEGEKGELKDKIKDITKKTLFNQLHEKSAAAVAAVTAGPMSMGPSLPMPVKVICPHAPYTRVVRCLQ